MEISTETPSPQEDLRIISGGFDEMARELGFIEADEMRRTRLEAAQLLDRDEIEKFDALYAKYDEQGTKLVEGSLKSPNIQIGFLIMKASMFHDGKYRLSFTLEWNDVCDYARNYNVQLNFQAVSTSHTSLGTI